jgi:trimeric autotransporter adhesin
MNRRTIGNTVRSAVFGGIVLISTACGGGSGGEQSSSQALRNANPLIIAGSIGDGPVTGAAVTVLDSRGQSVVAGVSNNSAGYEITVPAGTAFPITVTASGGTDLVSGVAPDFDLKAVLLDPAINRVNVSPFSSLALAVARCTNKVNGSGLSNAWSILSTRLSMGLDPARVPNPTNGVIDASNVADIVLANEALGEALRRTQVALAATSAAADAATIVERLGCDLGDGVIDGAGGNADPRTAATFAAASVGVMLEVIAGKLQVNGSDAMGAMDQAIQTVLPGTDASVTTLSVPVSDALVKQARDALAVVMSTLPDDVLFDYSILLASTSGADARAALAAAFTSADMVTFDGLAARVASGDQTDVATVSEAALQQSTATPPIVSLAASPSSVAAGASSLLSWSTVDAQRCKASGGWNGRKPAQGTYTTGALQTSQTYGLQCVGLGGTTSAQTAVQVTPSGSVPPAAPVTALTANPASITSGSSSTLSWSATNSDSCVASGAWSGTKSVSGTQSIGPLTANATYSLVCTGVGGSSSATATVLVQAPEAAPTLTLAASPLSVASGGSSTLSWSAANATSCTASGSWTGTKATSGTQTTGALTANASYTLTCTGAGGSVSRTAAITITAPGAPTLTFTSSPLSIASGASSTLTWSTTNTTSCTASGSWTGTKATSGTQTTGALTANAGYTLTCTGAGGSVAQTAPVTVLPRPTLTLTATPANVASGSSSTLTWSSTNATSCTASGSWTGTKATSGTQTTGALTANASYTLSCTGAGGSVSQTTAVAVLPAPTLTFTASPLSVASGASSTLTWSTTNATNCTASGSWTGTKATSGTQTTGALTANASYTLTCTGTGGSVSKTAAVTVVSAPTLTFTASPLSVASGASSMLTWSTTNATSCTASGSWTATKATSGSQTTGALTANASYTLTCTGAGGSVSKTAGVTVTAAPPTLTLTASPTTVQSGTASNLTWSTTNATSCAASGSWSGAKGTSGTQSTGALTATSSFTLACAGGGGTATQSATVTVIAGTPSVTLSANPRGVARNTSTTLSWTSANVSSCAASGAWSGTKAISGSESVGPISQDSTYSLSCSGTGGSAVAMTTVSLREAVLSWQAPTKNVDGSTLTNLAGYKIYYGTSSKNYTQTVSVSGASTTTWTLSLAPGTYYFALSAVDTSGGESAKTNEVSKTVN